MPETYEGYHLFQLCLPKGSELSVSFFEHRTEYINGFRDVTNFGSRDGLKRWSLPFEHAHDFTADATNTFRGTDYTRVDYLLNLFYYNKKTGTPFVIQSPKNNQYYLAEFDESDFSLQKKLNAAYSTQIKLKQVRLQGVSIMDYSQIDGIFGQYKASYFGDTYGTTDGGSLSALNWDSQLDTANSIGNNGTITYETNEQNGLPVASLDGSTGYFARGGATTIYEVFMIVKFRSASFSDYGGVLTDDATIDGLVTNNSDTIMYNYSYTNYEYSKNGVLFASDDQQAPMNEFGLIHARFQDSLPLANIQIGKQKNLAKYAAMDIGELILCTSLLKEQDVAEITEDMIKRWGITG